MATVHVADCGFCNHGKGTARKISNSPNCRWLGPFEYLAQAQESAGKTGRQNRTHRCCGDEYRSQTRTNNYTRFQLPKFDESKLSLEELFHYRMLQIYVVLRDEIGYSATRFLRSVRAHGGVEHAKRALRRPAAMQSGLQRLADEGRLHQSMEAFVVLPEFAPIFTKTEIAEARSRLAKAMRPS